MKTILCAVDYSTNAIAALKYADALSSKINSKLNVLHVYDNLTLGSTVNDTHLLPKKELKKEKLFKLKNFCRQHLGNKTDPKNIEIEVVENVSVVEGINIQAKKTKASLIFTGMKGKGKLKSFFMGSTTKELISNAPCPVFSIPEKYVLKNLNTIVYATAFEQQDIYAVAKLSEIASVFDATIKVIHISPLSEKDGATQMEWFKEMLLQRVNYDKIDFNIYSSNDTIYFLRLYLIEVKADIVAMLERNNIKTFFNKIFQNDLVKEMETLALLPLISFNEKNFKKNNGEIALKQELSLKKLNLL